MSKRLEAIERMARGEVPQAPVARLIGFELTSIRHGESVIELEASDSHANPMGTLHGGILCDIADAAMGIAFASTLDDGESFTTLELKINFLRPVWKEKLRALGKVVKRGKSIGMVECEVWNSQDVLVAKSSSTCLVLRGEQAAGR
ncbi:MAG TPA: PaaI family thioesterase [Candidatus Acidoferrum sp.]|nr:PaaI family thioesterase [Candidatus Acidoferrum sp.]